MTEVHHPYSEEKLRDVLLWAAADHVPLEIIGHGTKRGLGEPVIAEQQLDLSGLAGVVSYQPEELTLTAGPGTPMAEIDALLEGSHQMLAFEPQDWGWVLGGSSSTGSLGGAVMVSSNGPRRFKAGAVRDHLLGFRGVSGRGEVFKAGGKVVKNVTGYDLSKMITGSYGTLAALTEVTFKVLPAPAKIYTLLVYGLDAAPALQLMRQAAGTAHEVSGLAYLPANVASQSGVDYISKPQQSVTAIRVEGPAISVHHRMEALRAFVASGLETEELHSHNSKRLWAEIRDVRLLPPTGGAVWRVSVPSTSAASIVSLCKPDYWVADWAGGLIWMHFDTARVDQGALIRGALIEGGQALLVRAPDDVRAATALFQPLAPTLAGLNQRVKENYDPHNILNPGRMTFVDKGGIG